VESEIIKKIRDGDDKAFAQLYDLYGEYSLRVASIVTRNSVDAADAVQETFIRVYNNIHSFNTSKAFKPWFYRILINECNRILKSKSKTIYMNDYLEKDLNIGKKDDYKFQEYEELYKALQDLDEINRLPIILKYVNDFTEKEISQILDSNINTVKSRLFKGRQKLKKVLEKIEERRTRHG